MKKVAQIMITVFFISSSITQAVITDVFISPEEPLTTDPITIIVTGLEGSGGITFYNSDFQIDETSLTLDLFLDAGHADIMTPWSHSEDIGTLLMGTYELTTNTFFQWDPQYNDSYYTTFEVTPEPATILLFSLGFITLRVRRRKD